MSKKLFISVALFSCGLATSLLAATSATFAEGSTNIFNDNYNDDRNRLRSNIIDMSPQGELSVIRVQNISDLQSPMLPIFVAPPLQDHGGFHDGGFHDGGFHDGGFHNGGWLPQS